MKQKYINIKDFDFFLNVPVSHDEVFAYFVKFPKEETPSRDYTRFESNEGCYSRWVLHSNLQTIMSSFRRAIHNPALLEIQISPVFI